ncbi:uncharacterized protein LOC128260821 [Drosophila gunungcola]|uniref:Kazal-like domain-containing protein n=1 Tax=Drosophila gunungcola TaxID=103775 RepID=A0A9Q0BKT7_9MUSC|nr:uncharacterized protein LOC128260821 [Drosophila gunungcola]KAI8035285.1 hypothetical protein M5D96_011943 [Drosophila gunungcola]
MRYIFVTLLLAIIHQQSSAVQQVQTEHTIVEEWSWRDNQGNGDSSGYQYATRLDNDEDLYDEDGDDEDEEEDDAEDLLAQAYAASPDEDEESCEYSCPRYYRPVCVLRNGRQVTFATPCEFHNQVRCASVLKSRGQGQSAPVFQYQHNGAC